MLNITMLLKQKVKDTLIIPMKQKPPFKLKLARKNNWYKVDMVECTLRTGVMDTLANTLINSTAFWGTALLTTTLKTILATKRKKVNNRCWHEIWAKNPSAWKRKSPDFRHIFEEGKHPYVKRPTRPELLYQYIKRPLFFASFACVSNLSSTSQKSIPININSSLPSVHFPLRKSKEDNDDK